MNFSEISVVPLCQASLCLDCEMITAAETHCLTCGSVALLNLARTLNGEESGSAEHGADIAATSRPFERNPTLALRC